jgi:hypothetical protein
LPVDNCSIALLSARSFLANEACASDALMFVFTTAMILVS